MLIKRYILLIFTIILITGINCSSPLQKIKAIRLKWDTSILDKELDTIFRIDGSFKLYFYKDIFLYEKEGIFIHADNKQEKVYTYWMYKQNHKKGLKYKGSFRDSIGTTFDVDSFLVKNAFKTFPFYSKENDIKVSKIESHNKQELIEKYVPKRRPDDSYPDTIIFRYNKSYQDIPFSFSPEIEEGKKSRVVEISNIYNPVKNSKYKAELKSRKMMFQIERISVENQQEKMLYFEKFRKSFEKLK